MNHPFDEFSKSLSQESVPRRESLRRLGLVFVGAVLSPLALGLKTASANPETRKWQPRRFRTASGKPSKGGSGQDPCQAFCRCRNKTQQSQCLAACRACSTDTSRIHGTCGNYVCCAAGQTYCGGYCANLSNDVNNCGACGHGCGAGLSCNNGTCSACPPGQTKCGNSCVNLSSDNANCGACGNACGAGTSCINGTCSGGGGDCPPGTDFMFDGNNCGACGHACQPLEFCSWGVCEGV
jgi:hypothetical protein